MLQYTDTDGRISVKPFRLFREKPDDGILFDYIAEAGSLLQAPMPLPFLTAPVEGAGYNTVNYNAETPAADGDLPGNWDAGTHSTAFFGHYGTFTYRDRKNSFWVYRGLHAGRPDLAAGSYNTRREL